MINYIFFLEEFELIIILKSFFDDFVIFIVLILILNLFFKINYVC